jgi:demethylmenaquinone methyltransferase/2-methoxy-6-polyprenyl-1,4-benzoquinol methylase
MSCPFLGGGFRHRQEYTWLWQSTQDFLRKKELLDLFGQAGLIDRQMKSRLFGACVLHKGKKPAVE